MNSTKPADDAALIEQALLAVVDATRAYLPPDGTDEQTCINRILEATDNPEISPIILRLEAKLQPPAAPEPDRYTLATRGILAAASIMLDQKHATNVGAGFHDDKRWFQAARAVLAKHFPPVEAERPTPSPKRLAEAEGAQQNETDGAEAAAPEPDRAEVLLNELASTVGGFDAKYPIAKRYLDEASVSTAERIEYERRILAAECEVEKLKRGRAEWEAERPVVVVPEDIRKMCFHIRGGYGHRAYAERLADFILSLDRKAKP